jgi:hypothetical protein
VRDGHYTIWHKPNVSRLGAALRECLGEAAPQGPGPEEEKETVAR